MLNDDDDVLSGKEEVVVDVELSSEVVDSTIDVLAVDGGDGSGGWDGVEEVGRAEESKSVEDVVVAVDADADLVA